MGRMNSKVFKVFVTLLAFGVLGLMGYLVFTATKPHEFGDTIDGRDQILAGKIDRRDLLAVAKNAKKMNQKVSFTEKQLNHYLAAYLQGSQSGISNKFTDVRAVWVDLRQDVMEVYIEREVAMKKEEEPDVEAGKEGGDVATGERRYHTTSIQLEIADKKLEDGTISRSFGIKHGTVGQTSTPGLFVKLVKPAFDNLAEVLSEEIQVGYKDMAMVHIKDGKIELDPRKVVITK